MVLYEMLTGLPPWYTKNKVELFDRLQNAPLKFPFYVNRPAASLISKLLKRNPSERLGSQGAWQVMQHPFFESIDWDALYSREVTPPFNPCKDMDSAGGAESAHNFEKEFKDLTLYSIDHGYGCKTKGEDVIKSKTNTTATADSKIDTSEMFLNFTYEEQSILDKENYTRRKIIK